MIGYVGDSISGREVWCENKLLNCFVRYGFIDV